MKIRNKTWLSSTVIQLHQWQLMCMIKRGDFALWKQELESGMCKCFMMFDMVLLNSWVTYIISRSSVIPIWAANNKYTKWQKNWQGICLKSFQQKNCSASKTPMPHLQSNNSSRSLLQNALIALLTLFKIIQNV